MIKKIICLVSGHKASIAQCPVTSAKLINCNRCGYSNNPHSNGMIFK